MSKAKPNKQKLRILLILLAITLFFFNQTTVKPQTEERTKAPLIINEFMPKKDSNSTICPNQEWVELYNNSETEIDLNNYLIDDLLDDFSTNQTNGSSAKILTDKTIQPKSFVVFCLGASFLNDSGDEINLVSNEYQILDSYQFDKAYDNLSYSLCPTSDSSYSFMLATPSAEAENNCQEDPLESTNSTDQTTTTPTPTLTATPTPTLIPTPTKTPVVYKDLILSEVYPAPNSNEAEWIELYNPYDYEVELINYFIDDIPQGSDPIEFTAKIKAKSYLTIDLSKNIFNNNQDTARLLDFNQNLISKISYSSTVKAKSWIRDKNNRICLSEPSKAKENPVCPSEQTDPTQTTEEENFTVLTTTENNKTEAEKQTIKQTNQATISKIENLLTSSFNTQTRTPSQVLGIQTNSHSISEGIEQTVLLNSLTILAIYIFYLWTKIKKSV